MKQKVTVARDNTTNIVGKGGFVLTGHLSLADTIEFDVAIQYMPWPNEGDHSLAESVFHYGSRIAQQDHDCGKLIAHINFGPMTMVITPLATATSSREIVFSACQVLVEGTPVGFAICDSMCYTPMLPCNIFKLPIASAEGSSDNSVIVGMDPLADYGASVCSLVVGLVFVAIEAATLEGGGTGTAVKQGTGIVGDQVQGAALDALSPRQIARDLFRAGFDDDPNTDGGTVASDALRRLAGPDMAAVHPLVDIFI
jgi:hypothetical protein